MGQEIGIGQMFTKRAFAKEWLWLVVSFVIVLARVSTKSGVTEPSEWISVALFLYGVLIVIRLTIWAIRIMIRPSS